jgi:hypothetical protein
MSVVMELGHAIIEYHTGMSMPLMVVIFHRGDWREFITVVWQIRL